MTFPCPLCNCMFNCLDSCTYHIMLLHSSALCSSKHQFNLLSNCDANCLIPAGLQQTYTSDIINVDNDTIIESQLTFQAKQLETCQLPTDLIQDQSFGIHASMLHPGSQQLSYMHDSYSNLLLPWNMTSKMVNSQYTLGLNCMPNLLFSSQVGEDVRQAQVYSSVGVIGNSLFPIYDNATTNVGYVRGNCTDVSNLEDPSFPQQCFINDCDVTELDGTVNDYPYVLNKSNSHLQGKVYMCGHCTYTSLRRDNLQSHIRVHTNKKSHKCPHCPYITAYSGNLTSHIRTHSGEKPFKCDRCHYASTHRSHLNCHKRIHTGEKPYKCSQCSYASADTSSLRTHVRVHNGYKPYECKECSYATSVITSLKAHMLRHTIKRKAQCNTCSYSCSNFHHLRMHMRKHHK